MNRGCHPLRYRVLRFGPQAPLEGHPDPQGQRFGRLPQGHWLPHPLDGRGIRQLLHQGGDGHPHQRVPVARRGNEENRSQGGQAVLLNR